MVIPKIYAFNNVFVHKGNTDKDKFARSSHNTFAKVINNFDVRRRFIATQNAAADGYENPMEDE